MKIESQFKEVPILRGFAEIAPIWELAEKHGSMICGGYARYCASQQCNPPKASDVDLFPQSDAGHEQLIAAIQAIGFEIKHENDISVTFKTLETPTKTSGGRSAQ